MIIGFGNDLIDIRRIERALVRFGARFEKRIFTQKEQALANRRRLRAATYAKRYAAKEACAKALGTGFRQSVFWRDIEVVKAPTGAPSLSLSNGAAARLAKITPAGATAHISLTLTDEPPLAQAVVIIMAVKND